MELKELSLPFNEEDIEWRLQSCGKKNGKIWGMCLAYITNRAIMERLDSICGPENWKNDYKEGPDGGILCGLSIRIGDEWITKWDGAEKTNIEAVKGGLSGAMKRAGVQWGMGRYLYKLEEGFATVSDKGTHRGKTKENEYFKWNPPSLPTWALPKGAKPTSKPEPQKKPTFTEIMVKESDRVGSEAYFKVLGGAGFESSDEIDDKEVQTKVWKELKELPNKEDK